MNQQTINVLLIEDRRGDANTINNLLSASAFPRYNIVWAEQLDEGLNLLKIGGFDVVLLSLNLSGSLSDQIYGRVQSTFPNLPIVPLVSISTGALGIYAMRAGAQNCLFKDELTTNILVQSITHVIERRKIQDRFQGVIETLEDGIIIVNGQGNVLYVNPAGEYLFGRAAIEMHDSPFGFPLVSGESTEIDILSSQNGPITVDMRVMGMEWDGDAAYLAALRDITNRKLAEERELELAIQQEKVKILSKFINDTSHDFRTPLSVINTHLYLIKRTGTVDDIEKHLDVIGEQVQHISQLVSNLIDMSQLDTTQELLSVNVNVNNFVQKVIDNIAPQAEQDDVKIRAKLGTKSMFVIGDEAQLIKAVGHIVDNAVHFSSTGNQVTIKTGVEQDQICISVIDEGPGISDEDMPHIFDRFYRGDKARPTDHGQNGLGLTIAKKVIELHHGWIDVKTQLGRGSLFRILLPRKL